MKISGVLAAAFLAIFGTFTTSAIAQASIDVAGVEASASFRADETPEMSPDSSPGRGQCELLQPGQPDRYGRHCTDRSRYAVLWDGAILDGVCFSTLDEAFTKMQSTRICHRRPPAHRGACRILNPTERDQSNRYCSDRNRYAVTYDGMILDGACFSLADEALNKMRQTRACGFNGPVQMGPCAILNAGGRDSTGRHCVDPNAYAVTYYGAIADGVCFSQIDLAVDKMLSLAACRN